MDQPRSWRHERRTSRRRRRARCWCACTRRPPRRLDGHERHAVDQRPVTGLAGRRTPFQGPNRGDRRGGGPERQRLQPGDEVFGWCTGRLRRVRERTGGSVRTQAGEPDIRAGGGGRVAATTALQPLRDDAGSGRAEGPDQRRLGRRRHVRGADREGAGRRGDRREQHARNWRCSARSAPITSSTTRARTSGRGASATTSSSTTWRPLDVRHAARTRADRDPDLQWRRALDRQAGSRIRGRARVACSCASRRDPPSSPKPGRPRGPEGSGRSRQGDARSSAARTRWRRPPRPSPTWPRDTREARSSSP